LPLRDSVALSIIVLPKVLGWSTKEAARLSRSKRCETAELLNGIGDLGSLELRAQASRRSPMKASV
jgi:hypothetical protein